MPDFIATFLGIDESTTKAGVGVRSATGDQAYADVENRGAIEWHGEPAFDLLELPGMIVEVLDALAAKGWKLATSGALSFSVRQHDMVLLGEDIEPLIPALSWQCNAATEQVARLRSLGAEDAVGRIEPRFILPKLMWALEKDPMLRGRVRCVMTTGDYLAYELTGEFRLSTSDALSNGLLWQSDKQLAADVILQVGLEAEWFPPIVQSGTVVGMVRHTANRGVWDELQRRLAGWRVVAGLGDNHATGVGSGGLVDDRTIVVSAGTSGTVNRRVKPNFALRGRAACFEFYDDRMLLLMLADCAAWYERFVKAEAGGAKHAQLNDLAAAADLGRVRRVVHRPDADEDQREQLPAEWKAMPLGEKTASTQLSIVAELLHLVRAMLDEAPEAPPVGRYILTGGMSQSPFFQQAFEAGIANLAPSASVLVGAQSDELSYQTAAYGALINAMLPDRNGDLAAICQELCPTKQCAKAAPEKRSTLSKLLASWTT